MYVPMISAFLLVLPLLAAALQIIFKDHGPMTAMAILPIFAKWYVFWAVGVRLFSAGMRQMTQPRYTAETILGIKSPDCLPLVRELGFGNTAMGSLGLASLFIPTLVVPVAMAGAIFYGLAGVNHLLHKQRNKLQNFAMLSDLFAASILILCSAASLIFAG
jgi:hypothetical protein